MTRVERLLIPVLIGVGAFFSVIGWRALSPKNIAWLAGGDPATYFLSWHFFRNTPWQLPLGMNPRYGAEFGSAIVFADNIPLLALPFKLVSRFLPQVFQYFGLWLLICFVLQACFAWLLLGLITRDRALRAMGSVVFVFSPPFLWRLQGHYALCGQWLILAALYLCLGPRRLARGSAWPILAFTVALVHPYLTAMVLALWLSDMARRLIFERKWLVDLLELAVVPSVVLLAVWQTGLFTSHELADVGFGRYRTNLAALADPSGWSYVLPDLPEGSGDYEGYCFLGLGGILVFLFALPRVRGALSALGQRRHYWPFLAVLIGSTLFAISNRIGFADRNLEIPLARFWLDRADLLRASGRMFWPVYYALLWLVMRALVTRHSPRFAQAVLGLAALLQVLDTSAGWLPIRKELAISGGAWESPLKASFWSKAAGQYRVLRMVPPKNHRSDYAPFAYFAAMNGLSTDAVYFARLDREKLYRAKRDDNMALSKGRFAPDTLYILDRHYEKMARWHVHRRFDLLSRIDGFLVVAPGWKCRPECATPGAHRDCARHCPER